MVKELCAASQPLGILFPERIELFPGKVLLFRAVEVFLELGHHALGDTIIFHLEVYRCPPDIDRFSAVRTELPLLETIHIGKRPAPPAADHQVHEHFVC